MDAILTKLIDQSPMAAALLILVIIFMRFISKERDRNERIETRAQESITNMGQECHAFQREMVAKADASHTKVSAALDRNTEAYARTSEVLDGVETLLRNKK